MSALDTSFASQLYTFTSFELLTGNTYMITAWIPINSTYTYGVCERAHFCMCVHCTCVALSSIAMRVCHTCVCVLLFYSVARQWGCSLRTSGPLTLNNGNNGISYTAEPPWTDFHEIWSACRYFCIDCQYQISCSWHVLLSICAIELTCFCYFCLLLGGVTQIGYGLVWSTFVSSASHRECLLFDGQATTGVILLLCKNCVWLTRYCQQKFGNKKW